MKSAVENTINEFTGNSFIPIVIGVTGHRDITKDDEELLKNSIRRCLEEDILSRYPVSSQEGYLLSALAEGADRLAASVALELGFKLGAILPMSPEEYSKDFQTQESRDEFNKLLKHSAFVFVAGTITKEPLGEIRNKCYWEAGVMIARYSHLLIALWDGEDTGKTGGTSEVVRMFQRGIPSLSGNTDDAITLPDCGPVIHIKTRRVSGEAALQDDQVGVYEWLKTEPAGIVSPIASSVEKQRWANIFGQIEEFNKNSKEFLSSPEGGNKVSSSRKYLVERHYDKLEQLGGKAKRIADFYSVADAMSINAQSKRTKLFKWIIMAAFLAVLAQEIYSGPFLVPWWLMTAVVFGAIAYWFVKKLSSNKLEDIYQDYRTLAEGARVHFFWNIAGITKRPSDYYLRDQRDELEWIRLALNTIDLPLSDTLPLIGEREGLEIALDDWLIVQRQYFDGDANKPGKAQSQDALEKKLSKYAGGFLYGAMGVVIANLIFHTFFSEHFKGIGEWVVQAFIVSYGSLFAAAAMTKAYTEVMGYREQANRYKKMGIYYRLSEKLVTNSLKQNDLNHAKAVLLDIGKHALAENGEWLLLHRKRPVEVPL